MKYPPWLIHSEEWPGPRNHASPCRWALQLGAEFRPVVCGADQVRTYSDPPILTSASLFRRDSCGAYWGILPFNPEWMVSQVGAHSVGFMVYRNGDKLQQQVNNYTGESVVSGT
jgi:hypothetical protein